jgi:hypothetical protein
MRNMLAFLAAMALAFACTGWYLEWFAFNSAPAPSGHRSVTIDVNTPKIAADLLEAEKKIEQKLADKAKDANTPAPTSAPKTAPKTTQDLGFPVIDLSADN